MELVFALAVCYEIISELGYSLLLFLSAEVNKIYVRSLNTFNCCDEIILPSHTSDYNNDFRTDYIAWSKILTNVH